MAEEEIQDAELVEDDAPDAIFEPAMAGPFTMVQAMAFGLVILLLSSTVLYYVFSSEEVVELEVVEPEYNDPRVFVTDSFGMPVDEAPLEIDYIFSDVGETGKEPSIGVTSNGCMFFIAMEKPMRSCDYGASWENTADITQAPFTSDPYGWVDPVTDRIFNIHMMGLFTTWIGWSDNNGESWLGNPYDSGPIPLNDHIKLGSGPWVDAGYGIPGQLSPLYSEAVYFCYNKLAGIFCYTSYDGGATFPTGGQIYGLATSNGGLHGARAEGQSADVTPDCRARSCSSNSLLPLHRSPGGANLVSLCSARLPLPRRRAE